MRLSRLRINRNIVECKVVFKLVLDFYFRVLIETSWNVKINKAISIVNSAVVLIETSWNVKEYYISSEMYKRRINRNIVECKGVTHNKDELHFWY